MQTEDVCTARLTHVSFRILFVWALPRPSHLSRVLLGRVAAVYEQHHEPTIYGRHVGAATRSTWAQSMAVSPLASSTVLVKAGAMLLFLSSALRFSQRRLFELRIPDQFDTWITCMYIVNK